MSRDAGLRRPVQQGPAAARQRRPAQAGRRSVARRLRRRKLTIKGIDDAAQLVVTATLNDGRLQDLSGDVQYASPTPRRRRVLPTGRVLPLANGTTEVVAKFGDKTVTVPVTVKHADENLPINFANQIVPIFTKLGCNCGGCHGKAGGPERLPPVAARLRAGPRLHDAREGRPRPAALPRRAGRAACCC